MWRVQTEHHKCYMCTNASAQSWKIHIQEFIKCVFPFKKLSCWAYNTAEKYYKDNRKKKKAHSDREFGFHLMSSPCSEVFESRFISHKLERIIWSFYQVIAIHRQPYDRIETREHPPVCNTDHGLPISFQWQGIYSTEILQRAIFPITESSRKRREGKDNLRKKIPIVLLRVQKESAISTPKQAHFYLR